MTITEQDIEFFKEAKRIQELWERRGPQIGDWVVERGYEDRPRLVIGVWATSIETTCEYGGRYYIKEQLIFVPRQGQLQEMLEERGYDWLLEVGALRGEDERYEAVLLGLCSKPDTKVKVRMYGPTPSIALGKCLLEVLEEKEK